MLRSRRTGSVAASLAAALSLLLLVPDVAQGQWTHRYPQVEGYSHHVYLEGYELPTLGTGVLDPAPAPDGRRIAFSSRGWIWVLDRITEEAWQLTWGGEMDFRPAWSPDGSRIAFVRDTGKETSIWIVDVETGEEREVVNSPAIDLDPAFSPDGRDLYYSSAERGDLDLWRLDLETGQRTRLTVAEGLELRPLPHPDGQRLVYLSKTRGGVDEVRIRDLGTGEDRVLREGRIASQARPALSPDGRTVAVNWPTVDGWELLLLDLEEPGPVVRLTRREGLPLTPAWSPDGEVVYYSEAGADGRFRLMKVPAAGGVESHLPVRSWSWAEATGRVRIRTREAGREGPAPVRLEVVDERGHPVVPDQGHPRFDGTSGRVFFHSPGVVEVEVPAGVVRVTATRGFTAPAASTEALVAPGLTRDVELELEPLWDPREDGWYSGEHHFHLNYGGPYRLEPGDLVLQMRGEDLDLATPLVANLHNRMEDREWAGWSRTGDPPLIHFGQEVRSHFLGHVGLMGIPELFWPWIWGPGYQVYGTDDRPNAEALAHARRLGGVSTYVHPVGNPDPFSREGTGGVPLELIPDAVLGDLDALEVACLWSNERGTSEVWYRILNLGVPLAPSAGTDVMTDFYRTMAVGTTRVYVRPRGPLNLSSYLKALREGRSFVTTGPLTDFRVTAPREENGDGLGEGAPPAGDPVRPGEVVPPGEASWTLHLHTPVPVERVEVLVNGEVVWDAEGLAEPGSRTYRGRVELPEGGWIAARALGGTPAWPSMNPDPFAHTAPVWIGRVGSHDPAARSRAAGELLGVLEAAEERLRQGYEGVPIPRLEARFLQARERLEKWSRE